MVTIIAFGFFFVLFHISKALYKEKAMNQIEPPLEAYQRGWSDGMEALYGSLSNQLPTNVTNVTIDAKILLDYHDPFNREKK